MPISLLALVRLTSNAIQTIEGLSDTDNFLKVPQSGTFKKLSGFYGSARRYRLDLIRFLLRFLQDLQVNYGS
jgi:hypothetical protein